MFIALDVGGSACYVLNHRGMPSYKMMLMLMHSMEYTTLHSSDGITRKKSKRQGIRT